MFNVLRKECVYFRMVYTIRADVSLLERIHVLIFYFCWKNSFIFIDNRNIRNNSLYKDGKRKGKADYII